jgi:hypothetical protein
MWMEVVCCPVACCHFFLSFLPYCDGVMDDLASVILMEGSERKGSGVQCTLYLLCTTIHNCLSTYLAYSTVLKYHMDGWMVRYCTYLYLFVHSITHSFVRLSLHSFPRRTTQIHKLTDALQRAHRLSARTGP